MNQLDLVSGSYTFILFHFYSFIHQTDFQFVSSSALAIAEPPRETYGDDDSDSMTGSTLSLNRPGKCDLFHLFLSYNFRFIIVVIFDPFILFKGVSNNHGPNHSAATTSASSSSPSSSFTPSSNSVSSNYAYTGRP